MRLLSRYMGKVLYLVVKNISREKAFGRVNTIRIENLYTVAFMKNLNGGLKLETYVQSTNSHKPGALCSEQSNSI